MMPESDHNRRAVIAKGIALLATGLAIPACASSRRPGTATLPGPIWPHEKHAHAPTPQKEAARTPVDHQRQVTVLSRSQWTNSQPIIAQTNPMVRIESITVHHDGMSPVSIRTQSDAADRIEMIRTSHVDHRGWADIGYHLVVDPQGRVWQARPINLQGAHVKDYNPRNLGVLVLGNFEIQHPTPAAKQTLDRLLAHQSKTHRVPINRIRTHREWASTACPGRNLQAHMNSARASSGSLSALLA
jgi:hypothetical protein